MIRLWHARVRINGENVKVGTIEKESSLRQIWGFKISLPLCAVSLPEARKEFLSSIRVPDINIQLSHAGKPHMGINILHQSYYFEGYVALATWTSQDSIQP
ncbi:MAG: hypothetical protein JRI81_06020 [Deltaproteobacteria bacterium]|nr:hypothetical protein [Deltaproteobacteria bacterium]